MRKALLLSILLALAVSAYSFRLGPAVRYMILTPTPMPETPGYEWSRSRIMFDEPSLILPGFTVQAPLPFGLIGSFDVYWRRYDPHYVGAPDSSDYSLERRGSLSVFDLGAGMIFGDFLLRAGADLQYYSEEWPDSFSGELESIDSLAAGPFLSISSEIPTPAVPLRVDFGLVFPALDDVQGWIDMSILLP